MQRIIRNCLFIILPVALIASCSGLSKYPVDVADALKKAGDNRGELEKVINHFNAAGDSLMLEAAYYLIGNMEGHNYAVIAYYDTSGNEVEIDVDAYPDFKSMLAFLDTVESERGEIEYEKKEVFEDLEHIKADFLINQIEYAFKAWRGLPWAKTVTFENFKKYILPYRGSNEPLEPWREYFFEKYSGIDTIMADPYDLIEAARIINSDVRSYFGFNERYYLHPTDQGLSEMLESGLGRCEDMTNLAIYAMRANGLAVTSDYTPYWANTGNNHAWNAIADIEGKVVPFMGAEADPGDYKLHNKAAKVYRKMFGKQKDNLIFQDRKQEKVPRWLGGKSYIDVTSDYVDVCDVTINFEKEIPDSVDIAYLCVFNSGEWKPIHWGRIENGSTVFTDMGVDVMYLPALYQNEEIEPFGPPILLDKNCTITEFKESQKSIDADLAYTTLRTLEISTNGVRKTEIKDDVQYELFYWEDGWQSLGKHSASDGALELDDVPAGCLYWMVAVGSGEEERIFTLENGKQVWW
ncbi:MAG: transglutaminase domain-containing protein [Candidatus Zixiibacteriota bacterium]|nr:MAG: transglutaminase domain-containing protein [candidate division Zixibacteria bacterium]